MNFSAAVTHEGEWFVARFFEFEKTSQGATEDDAVANLREALELLFEDQRTRSNVENPVITTFRLTA
jgi:predicted RNase H-like HicB family nuclease